MIRVLPKFLKRETHRLLQGDKTTSHYHYIVVDVEKLKAFLASKGDEVVGDANSVNGCPIYNFLKPSIPDMETTLDNSIRIGKSTYYYFAQPVIENFIWRVDTQYRKHLTGNECNALLAEALKERNANDISLLTRS